MKKSQFIANEFALVTKDDKYGKEKLLVQFCDKEEDGAQVISGIIMDEDKAVFMIHASNCFDELLQLAESAENIIDLHLPKDSPWLKTARKIIKTAKGK